MSSAIFSSDTDPSDTEDDASKASHSLRSEEETFFDPPHVNCISDESSESLLKDAFGSESSVIELSENVEDPRCIRSGSSSNSRFRLYTYEYKN